MGNRKYKVLFVDDDLLLIRGLRRNFDPLHKKWDISCAESGEEGLRMMEEQPFDALVTDMRMPGMSGVELLEQVAERFPWMARFALSGQSEEKMILRGVHLVHQYFSKPCDMKRLEERLRRTCDMRELFQDPDMQELVSHFKNVPVLPQTYVELALEFDQKRVDLGRVTEIVRHDVYLIGKIMHIANSSFLGTGQEIRSLQGAIEFLGVETLRSLVMGSEIFRSVDTRDKGVSEMLRLISEHSIKTAIFARQIANMENAKHEDVDAAFTIGLLHSLGNVVFLLNQPERCYEAVELSHSKRISLDEAERHIFKNSASEVGAYLLNLWGLPDRIVSGVLYIETPSECRPEDFFTVLAAHAAHRISPLAFESSCRGVDKKSLEMSGLEDHLESWLLLCQVTDEESLGKLYLN